MRLTGLLFATAAVLSMIAAPALADPANPAAKLSLTNAKSGVAASAGPSSDVRAGARTRRSSKFAMTLPLLLLAAAATTGIVAGAVASSHSDSKPASS